MEEVSSEKRWVVGITDYIIPPADIESRAFPEAEFCFLPDWRKTEAGISQWRNVDALLVWHWHVDQQTIDLLDRCRVVVRYGVGYDLIDVASLAGRGIPLCNTPDYGTEEVADTACAMILALQRKILTYDRASRTITTGWQENLIKPQRRTNTQNLGIIGVGRIGTAVVNRMRPFGYRIFGYDPYQPSGHEKAIGYNRVNSLDELLSVADIISIHCPLTPETRGMIDESFIDKMRPGSALVNTARGAIIKDLGLLESALKSGQLASVALDVLPDEPPVAHSLIQAWRKDEAWLGGRLIINPHSAYYSEEGWYEMRYKAAETVRMYLIEGRLRNLIDPTRPFT